MHADPSDLRLILAKRKSRQPLDWQDFGLIDALVRVCELLEPDLIWSDDASRVDWLTTLAKVRFYLTAWRAPDTATRELTLSSHDADQLAILAAKGWRGPSKGPRRPLPFIKNPEFRAIAERDLASLNSARRADEVKIALVLAGSVIEATLADVVSRDPVSSAAAAGTIPQAKTWNKFNPKDPSGWNFFQMISVCGPQGLKVLSDKTEKIAHTVRDWRNFVHPEKERTETRGAPLRPSDAAVAEALVEKVLDEVGNWTPP